MNLKILSSMAKVFPEGIPARYGDRNHFYVLKGEPVYFQAAFSIKDSEAELQESRDVYLTLDCRADVRLFEVKYVYVNKPVGRIWDEDYLSVEPGLYPDLLWPLNEKGCLRAADFYKSVLIEIKGLEPGNHRIPVLIKNDTGLTLSKREVYIEVSEASPAPQRLKYTRWFHTDCLASLYGFEVFSEEYWRCVESFLQAASEQGMNMVYTPIHTPPLDTEIGGERPTVQLVDITLLPEGRYAFSYENLDRFVEISRRCSMEYFELAHLYTQWGAKAAPKIVAHLPGEENRQIFGWDTPACSSEYASFLAQYLQSLLSHLKELGIAEKCTFHISDEPSMEDAESYRRARAQVEPYLKGYPIMDALSEAELFRNGTISLPVPSNNHAEDFEKEDIPERWTYYCCAQLKDVSNSFIAMPGERTRILGIQLLRKGYRGFLQWGLNFYFSDGSKKLMNPLIDTDGISVWPAGDPFNLYPGFDRKPLKSLRAILMAQAVMDYRALDALKEKIGIEETEEFIDRLAGERITFSSYPRAEEFLLDLRKELFCKLAGN